MQIKVLMVCLGNICRSPLAEGILQSKVNPEKVLVDSAGTGSWHVGHPPDPRSIAVAQKYGLNIGLQRCRQFEVEDFDRFDRIYVMDQSNYTNVVREARDSSDSAKVRLLLSEGNAIATEVPDPYYDSENGFEQVYHLIDQACDAIADKLNTIST